MKWETDADVVIVGAGPSGIFTALGLLKERPDARIVLVDAGLPVEQRKCPKEHAGECVGCDPCRITTGFSGAGAFSDGKLSLSAEVGGDLPELIGFDAAQAAIGIHRRHALRFFVCGFFAAFSARTAAITPSVKPAGTSSSSSSPRAACRAVSSPSSLLHFSHSLT